MSRPTSSHVEPSVDGPSAGARFELAYQRLAEEDARRSAELTRLCNIRPRAARDDCSGPECKRKAEIRGLCPAHSAQRRAGKPLTSLRTKPGPPSDQEKALAALARSRSAAARIVVGA